MKVAEWLEGHPAEAVTVMPEDTLETLLERLLAPSCCLRDLYVLLGDGSLAGHISRKRLAAYLLSEHRPVHTRRQLMDRVAGVGSALDFMDRHFPTAAPDEELEDVLHRQLEHEIEDMPVIDASGALLGAVNLTQVLRELGHDLVSPPQGEQA